MQREVKTNEKYFGSGALLEGDKELLDHQLVAGKEQICCSNNLGRQAAACSGSWYERKGRMLSL